MANTKSAKAKVREIRNKTLINKSVKNRYRTYIKKVEQLIENKDVKEAKRLSSWFYLSINFITNYCFYPYKNF